MAKHSPYPSSVETLIGEFAKLPGIGKRSAERLAFHVLSTPRDSAMALALAIRDARKNLRAWTIRNRRKRNKARGLGQSLYL